MIEPTARAMSLLLVDDEPSVLSALRRLFRPEGYTVHVADSGASALDILAHHPVDVVISDMRMPQMTGAEFLDQVCHRWPHTVRMLLTGYSDMGSTVDAINRGEITRFIAKPWDDDELRMTVREAMRGQTLRLENARLQALTQTQNAQLHELNTGLERLIDERTAELKALNQSLGLVNDKLRQRFLVTVKMFSGLLELRGGAVAGHSRRVADMARQLAVHMRLDEQQQNDVYLAGLMHDIGKIGLADSLLTRPVSKMNGIDKAEYSKHAADGAAALMPLDEFKSVAQIVRAHHERFDGHGFPDGLIGGEIPFGARLLSVVNDFDALQAGTLSERRLRADEARQTLLHARGKQYDPVVVDAFLSMNSRPAPQSPHDRMVAHTELEPGMILVEDLLTTGGALLLAAGCELDAATIGHVNDFARRQGLTLNLHVHTQH